MLLEEQEGRKGCLMIDQSESSCVMRRKGQFCTKRNHPEEDFRKKSANRPYTTVFLRRRNVSANLRKKS